MMMRVVGRLVVPAVLLILVWPRLAIGAEAGESSGRIWKQLVMEAQKMGLPIRFLKVVPPDFVTFEFDDLQAFAAEYHLGEHRMVLNRTLSFNIAGGTLRPLKRMTHVEIETLYHELFHAYMDYLSTKSGDAAPLLSFARAQRRCRYSAVLITPVVQRKAETEERFLTEGESWEVLNEAWAVFIGWAVWNQLESAGSAGTSISKPGTARDAWLRRLQEADREGKIRGYYEPEDKEERAITRKRFLAPASRISKEEVARLMDEALGYPADLARQATRTLAASQVDLSPNEPCR